MLLNWFLTSVLLAPPAPPLSLNSFLNFVLKLLVLLTSLTECPCYSMMVIQLLVIAWAL